MFPQEDMEMPGLLAKEFIVEFGGTGILEEQHVDFEEL